MVLHTIYTIILNSRNQPLLDTTLYLLSYHSKGKPKMQNKVENLRQIFGELFNRIHLANEGKAKGQAGSMAGEKAKHLQHVN